MALEGKQIDRYRILDMLGSGGMGDVYLAEDPRIGQQVAIKVIRTEVTPYSDDDLAKDAQRHFQREAKAIVRLDHQHILPLYDYGEEFIANMPIIYLVMPYRPEGSLSDWLHRRGTKEILSPQDVAHIVSQAADALQHAHDHHVIHQDVKPANFLVRTQQDASTRPDLLLSDFGIARLSNATASVSQSVLGTPSYMAPEQWEGEPTPATDQYALAVMAYELLTGKLPFQGSPTKIMYQHLHVPPQPPSMLNPELTVDLDEVMLHALAKQPQERFTSIKEFAAAFQQAVEGATKVEIKSLPDQSEMAKEAIIPDANADAAMSAPTLLTSTTPDANDEAEMSAEALISQTRPAYIREPVSSYTQYSSKNEEQASHLKPTVIPSTTTPHKGKKRVLALLTLIILVVSLTGGALAYARPVLFGPMAGKYTRSAGSTTSASGATFASIAIVPALKTLQSPFSIAAVTGAPDKAMHQYQGARYLSATTSSYTQTSKATGQGTIPGTHASGTACIDNFNTSASLTLQAGSVYSNTYPNAPFFHMVLDVTETLPPAPSSTIWSQKCAPAHALEVGTVGNNIFNSNQYGTVSFSVFTNSSLAFTNGKNSQNYVAVQQSDIDNAVSSLEKTYAPEPQQALQGQVQSDERYINAPHCNSNATSNYAAGAAATSVKVTVSFTCAGEVYNDNGAQAMASQLLHDQANTELGSNYLQVGNITTTLTSATLTDANQGTITLVVTAKGTWVYQFTDTQKQALAKLIAGKTKNEAQTLLLSQTGIAKASVQISGVSNGTLPADTRKITITVQN